MHKKQFRALLICAPLVFSLISASSCESEVCYDCDSPPLPPPKGARIEGYIDEKDKFVGTSVAYCHFHYNDKTDRGLTADKLKAKWYYWNNELNFETDIYYTDKENISAEQNQKTAVIYSPGFSDPGQFVKIVRLNEKGEEIHILGEIKAENFPKPKGGAYDCEKIPLPKARE